ncbi:hypothetical protein EN780_04310 [Mesorhizobium sp. M4B.F.Ca.ET.089.01.1.1]|nr:hypothetical protein EN780_04310 [Mesorhizobium sp. M4B.F.Ca.ET.089.01.1.1]
MKLVRVIVTIPEDVLHQINQAERHGYSPSGFLTAAAKMAMRTEAAWRFRNLIQAEALSCCSRRAFALWRPRSSRAEKPCLTS